MSQPDPITDVTIGGLRNSVRDLIRADTQDMTDRAWFLAVYLSLATAWRLGLERHAFSVDDLVAEQVMFLEILQEDSLASLCPAAALAVQRRRWLAAHFYNNALLRIPPLAEIRLGQLWEKHERELLWRPDKYGRRQPQHKWPYLRNWYERKFGENLATLTAARDQVNAFKHQPDAADRMLTFGTMPDAVSAFQELLSIARRLLDP